MAENKGIHVEEDILDCLMVGAGPCGLSVAARLREHTPAALFTDEEHRRYHWIGKYGKRVTLKHVKSGKISNGQTARPEYKMMVLDATEGSWMGRWNKLFRMYGITHLRSPMLWHVDPQDRDALLSHAYSNEREDELVEIRNCVGKEVSKHFAKKRNSAGRRACGGKQEARIAINLRERNDYYTPSTALFNDHCEKVADRYHLGAESIRKESVEHIDYGIVKGISIDDEKLFTVTSNQVRRYARTVVLAVGPANAAKIPQIPSMPAAESMPQACHSMHIERFPDPVVLERIKARRATNVLVVGGGLTSAQLSDLAIRRGVTKVWHVMRGPLRIKHFDVDLEWMGKYKNAEQARFWTADSDDERLEIIKAARGGGSITPLFHKRLKKHLATKKLELHTETSLVDAKFDGTDGDGMWTVQTNPPIAGLPAMDYIYFATGIQTDFSTLPYLQTMLKNFPIEGRGGFPCLNEDLMWNSDVPLFMSGRMAALQLGPAAPNLGGAKVGAERIAWAIEDLVPRPGLLGDDDDGHDGGTADGLAGARRFAGSDSTHTPASDARSPELSAQPQTAQPPSQTRASNPLIQLPLPTTTLAFFTLSSNDYTLPADQPPCQMARMGSTKVRTGCATCKYVVARDPPSSGRLTRARERIRKVKCDETWPQCLRCKKTGRTCDGYRAPPTGSLSWDVLLHPQRPVTPTCDVMELRSLAFFHQVVAPVLSGPFDASFWTHLVAQATHHEPAARHAVLAISSFFEGFSATTCRSKANNPFAILHYNRAIKRVITSQVKDINSILVVCILFICIEFLRGDEKAAISHTRHGVRVLSAAPDSSKVASASIFCHMSIFPLFFGGAIADFPLLTKHAPKATGAFQSIIEAQHALDILDARAVRLVRMSSAYEIQPLTDKGLSNSVLGEEQPGEPRDLGTPLARFFAVNTPQDDEWEAMLDEQRSLGAAIEDWGKAFARFQATRSAHFHEDTATLALKIRWLVSKIWVRCCLTREEMVYDGAKPEFESIVNLARCALSKTPAKPTEFPKKFMFDMGFGPLLHFVVIKCRYLHLRVAALSLMKALSRQRESLWDSLTMYMIGERTIEEEHGIELRGDLKGHAQDAELPSEEDRIRGYFLEEAHEVVVAGVVLRRRCLCILRLNAEGGMETQREWITVHTER
ncbi:hypothetical protein AK830_g11972 [Neonectria ditissima]|uniref:Zn(2)-C6 fungal-type domain-containing protein n=1 Tax=Neonectria ditissima TaxID=78410 RepID=A0A0P7ABN7_9HYPO|nr:hypothetical protein AK830_g11972 [Neonectria ditissima]